MSTVVDLTQLRDSLVNEVRVQAVVDLFMADAPRLVASMQQALDAGQLPELASAAHTLKGASQYFCSEALVAACQDLERVALSPEQPESGAVAALVARVGSACSSVQSALQAQRTQSTA
jgi:HPt (histidine-containing phosphotransfer) domain-containing protein